MPNLDSCVDPLSIVRVHASFQTVLIENDGGGNPVYVGWAEPGNLSSDPVWRISKITGGSAPTAVQWANGNIYYSNIWDDRAVLTYS